MERKISMIEDINPSTKNPWTVKVTIIEKFPPRQPISSPNKYQRMVLVDSMGTRVQATIFGRDIKLFEDNLALHTKYYISNAIVRPIDLKHRMVPHHYQWIINNRSLVVKVDDDDDDDVICPSLTFITLDKLGEYKDMTSTIDVLACALSLLPKKQQNTRNGFATLQELIIIDNNLQPTMLTMWNEFIDNEVPALSKILCERPIIEIRRVKVVSYNGISLSTRSTSSLIIKPNHPEATILQSWLADNDDKIAALFTSESFLSLTTPKTDSINDIIQIASLETLPNNTTFALRCQLSITDVHQLFWYMGCNSCHKSTSATYMENFTMQLL